MDYPPEVRLGFNLSPSGFRASGCPVSFVPMLVHGLSRPTQPRRVICQLLDVTPGEVFDGIRGRLPQGTEQPLGDQDRKID